MPVITMVKMITPRPIGMPSVVTPLPMMVYFHVTNLEQDWDVPHGFAIKGAANAEILVMPGETQTLKWVPDEVGVSPFYCTDFCSALHQEMSGYARVSPAGSNVPIKFSTGVIAPEGKGTAK